MDFWYLFTCHALDLLKEDGLHSFIAPSNWITSAGASILRNKILSDSKLISFFDFNDFKVFKEASIQTMVFVLEKKKLQKTYSMNYCKIIDKNISKEELRNYLAIGKDGSQIEKFKVKLIPAELIDKTISFTNSEMSSIIDKIKERGDYYLSEKEITNGLQVQQEYVTKSHLDKLGTGYKLREGIFILNDAEKKSLNLLKNEEILIKPLFTPNEIEKWKTINKNKFWVIYTESKFKNPSEIKPYPHIKEHLDRFRKVITTDFKPYGIHRTRVENFFKGEKIVSIRKSMKPSFSYVDFDSYVNQVYYVIKTDKINLKYLTALLNSKLMYFWLYFKGKKQGEQLQVDKAPLLEIPIYKPEENNKEQQEIIKLVDLLRELTEKLQGVKLDSEKAMIEKQILAYEEKIDDLIFKLYGLNKEEIETIKESVK